MSSQSSGLSIGPQCGYNRHKPDFGSFPASTRTSYGTGDQPAIPEAAFVRMNVEGS
ncbi:MAG: hypothetical protein ACYDAZ_02220 [Thermoplasmataceae archaeon]